MILRLYLQSVNIEVTPWVTTKLHSIGITVLRFYMDLGNISVREAAEELEWSTQSVYKAMKKNQIASNRVYDNGKVAVEIPIFDFLRFLASEQKTLLARLKHLQEVEERMRRKSCVHNLSKLKKPMKKRSFLGMKL